MNEENMSSSNEETQALFVSTQKKKQAEEEARKKAAEEQAKREAAEAEVRRLEEELEARKRKAEEEKKALEEASAAKNAKTAQADKLKAADSTSDGKITKNAGSGGNSKLPLFIGIGVAVAAAILIAVFALGKKGGATADLATVEFNEEYETTTEGVGLTFLYPGSIYTEVTEEGNESDDTAVFSSGDSSVPKMVVYASKVLRKGEIGFLSAKELQNALTSGLKESINKSEGEITIADEQGTDIASENPGKYSYKCSFSNGNGLNSSLVSWIAPNANGDYMLIGAVFSGNDKNSETIARLCEQFEDKNSGNALKVPGENPPESADTDGMLEIDPIHMGVPVPKDRFEKLETGNDDSFYAWSDDNGAMVIVTFNETEDTHEDVLSNQETALGIFKEMSQTGINNIHPYVESRMYVRDLPLPENLVGYSAEFKDAIGGVTFWEGYNSSLWCDTRTGKYYYYELIVLAPEKNADIYSEIFNKAIDRIQDI